MIEKKAVAIREIVHRNRNTFLDASPFGNQPDRDFWDSCLRAITVEVEPQVFSGASDLKSWIQKPMERWCSIEDVNRRQWASNTREQELKYEWYHYQCCRNVYIHLAKTQESLVKFLGPLEFEQILRTESNIPEGETNFSSFMLADGLTKALHKRKHSLKRAFRRTRNYSAHPGESDSDEYLDTDEDDSNFYSSSWEDDPDALQSIERDWEQSSADGDSSGDDMGSDDGSVRNDNEAHTAPRSGSAEEHLEEASRTSPELLKKLKTFEEMFIRESLSSSHVALSKGSRSHSVAMNKANASRVVSRSDATGTGLGQTSRLTDKVTESSIDIKQSSLDVQSQLEQQDEFMAEMRNSAVESSQHFPTQQHNVDEDASSMKSQSPSIAPKISLEVEQRTPSPMPTGPRATMPIQKHSLKALDVDHASSSLHEFGPDPFEEPKKLSTIALDLTSVGDNPLGLQDNIDEVVMGTTEDSRTHMRVLKHMYREGTHPDLRHENESHALKLKRVTRIHLPRVDQLKTLVVPHQLEIPSSKSEQPGFARPLRRLEEISTSDFYRSRPIGDQLQNSAAQKRQLPKDGAFAREVSEARTSKKPRLDSRVSTALQQLNRKPLRQRSEMGKGVTTREEPSHQEGSMSPKKKFQHHSVWESTPVNENNPSSLNVLSRLNVRDYRDPQNGHELPRSFNLRPAQERRSRMPITRGVNPDDMLTSKMITSPDGRQTSPAIPRLTRNSAFQRSDTVDTELFLRLATPESKCLYDRVTAIDAELASLKRTVKNNTSVRQTNPDSRLVGGSPENL